MTKSLSDSFNFKQFVWRLLSNHVGRESLTELPLWLFDKPMLPQSQVYSSWHAVSVCTRDTAADILHSVVSEQKYDHYGTWYLEFVDKCETKVDLAIPFTMNCRL